jgi:hypothetical protein
LQFNLFFHGLALLCSLASVVFATLDARPRGLALIAVGFLAAVLAVRPFSPPDPAVVGGLAACLAVVAILRPYGWTRAVIALSAGALAGLWSTMLGLAGVSLPVAVTVGCAAPAASACFSRVRCDFAPPGLREEALLVVLIFGVVIALAPGVVAGWQSASVLNLQQQPVTAQVVPMWTLLLTLGAAALGGLYTGWTRR